FLAFVMAFTNGRLLINRSVSLSEEQEIRDFISGLDPVDNITAFKTEILAPDQVKLSIEIDFNSQFITEGISGDISDLNKERIDNTVQKIIHTSIRGVGSAINDMEKQIQSRFQDIKYIDLEIN
ncbi:MAG: hypothetical protein QF856_03430, partial [Candidatus Marinimicrobia bacterium]|nr:hypothetical protein [Candidatus Neomarinimicrobiota bacterium]